MELSFLELINNKITSLESIQTVVAQHKFFNKKIVFTNGCFDLLHVGHLDYLSKARDLGDLLIIGTNTDRSIAKLKGASRPIQNLYSRQLMLASLMFVDYIIPFEEDTPYNLIKEIRPDFLVKGADYNKEEIVGYDIVKSYGGKVHTIPFVAGYSTSSIIKRIKSNG